MTTWTGGSPAFSRPHGDAYEELVSRVYITAVRLGRPTRDALRNEGLRDEEIDDLTAELVARELFLPGIDPDSWQVAPPREAMTRIADRIERRAAMSRATASEVEQLWRAAVGDGRVMEAPGMDLLKGVQDIVDRVRGLHRVAEERLWWAMDASAASCQLLQQAADDPDLLSIRPGADVRVMLDTALLEDEAALRFMERHEAAGHPVRVGNGIPFSLLLCDNRAALLDLSRHDPLGDGSLEARRTGPLLAIGTLLDEIWQLCTPYRTTAEAAARAPGSRAPLDQRDLRILNLLTTGASDQLIARQTGVSVRTVERRVRYLMDHLAAATRFQAGVQAVRRGWV
ncbi:helix-turn-helix transcriptional regulator [Ornithinimicrobium cerasi]|uniref:helix-turn-helix transcriptional regulator n=1 Tax=Ornithinimicrobium cerasi TaxID=2248773 RepID=UPI00137B669F|nr:LuxR C-terminal-related transcriptional regulator [Ornithinimicrobium cerasi]